MPRTRRCSEHKRFLRVTTKLEFCRLGELWIKNNRSSHPWWPEGKEKKWQGRFVIAVHNRRELIWCLLACATMPFCLIFVTPSYLFRVRVAQSKEKKKMKWLQFSNLWRVIVITVMKLEPTWTLAGSEFETLSDFYLERSSRVHLLDPVCKILPLMFHLKCFECFVSYRRK